MTLKEQMERRKYGSCAYLKGDKFNPERCAMGVHPRDEWHEHQCRRKPGHGEEELFCKQHAYS